MISFMQPVLQPIAAVLHSLLTLLFHLSHDWGVALIALTLLVRLALGALNLRTARQFVRQHKIKPELAKLREKHKDTPQKLAQETMALYRNNGVKPFSSIGTALLQMPIFMGMYSMFASHGSAMTSVLVPWVDTFAHADPFHLVPAIVGVLTFAVSFIPLVGESEMAASPVNQRLLLAAVISLVFAGVMWRAPVALGLYSLSGSLFALLERAFYRLKTGRSLLQKPVKQAA
ncbi:YidC/Oxa1 family membrane protein insertase [Paenibacillus sp. MBLB4367]|uniref:YidC/Oxa1 family membrane protein insertase n=1 Tax=Paenibacillus sp. MBLB4367 TaxID=3384767 RepID=UPI0039082712